MHLYVVDNGLVRRARRSLLASLVLFVVALLARGSVLGVLLGLDPSHALVELLLVELHELL